MVTTDAAATAIFTPIEIWFDPGGDKNGEVSENVFLNH